MAKRAYKPRKAARGGREAKRQAAHERYLDGLYERGVLTRPEFAREIAQAADEAARELATESAQPVQPEQHPHSAYSLLIDPEFESLIPPQTDEENMALEESLLREGCRDALVVWKDHNILVDGHNRYAICKRHGLSYAVREREFASREDVVVWMVQNQLARRNIAPFTRGELALRMKAAVEAKKKANQLSGLKQGTEMPVPQIFAERGETRDELGKVAEVSRETIRKVETIVKEAPKPIQEKARSGQISTNRAYLMTKALKDAHSRVIGVVDKLDIDEPKKVEILTRLHKSAGSPSTNGTFYDIELSGGFHYGTDMRLWCNFAEDTVEVINTALKDLSEQHKRLAYQQALADQQPTELEPDKNLIRGDCLKVDWPVDAQLVIADPPYGLTKGNNAGVRDGKGDWDELDYCDLHAFNVAWIGKALESLADGGSLLVFGTLHNIFSVGHILRERGVYIVRDIVWNKPFVQRAVNVNQLVPSHEIILWARKGTSHTCNLSEITRDVWDVQPAAPFHHPTEKPEKLITRLIEMTTNVGDLVIDPFMGSGVSAFVSRQLKREFFGVEKDAYWWEIATQRSRG